MLCKYIDSLNADLAYLSSLNFFDSMWHRIAAFVITYRIYLHLLLLGLTAFMGYEASKVQLSYDSTGAIPTDNPKYLEYQAFKKQFGQDGTMMVVAVQTEHFFEPNF